MRHRLRMAANRQLANARALKSVGVAFIAAICGALLGIWLADNVFYPRLQPSLMVIMAAIAAWAGWTGRLGRWLRALFRRVE